MLWRLTEQPKDDDLRRLDGFLARGAVRRRLVDGAIALEPLEPDWEWQLSEIAAAFVPLLAERERLKVCANHECQWVFVDQSRNRVRRWCGASSCGNNDKVRRFRERFFCHFSIDSMVIDPRRAPLLT